MNEKTVERTSSDARARWLRAARTALLVKGILCHTDGLSRGRAFFVLQSGQRFKNVVQVDRLLDLARKRAVLGKFAELADVRH